MTILIHLSCCLTLVDILQTKVTMTRREQDEKFDEQMNHFVY